MRAGPAAPPGQPPDGPGGAAYAHRAVHASRYGSGATAYWLFEPGAPLPARAPLVVFLHGWSATQPAGYGAWIDHLAKRGNVVVYPVYQADLRTPVADFAGHAVAAVKDAVARLAAPGHPKPDLDRVAFVGHSMGGALAPILAARWQELGVPRPKAVMAVEPGKTWMKAARAAISTTSTTVPPCAAIAGARLALTRIGPPPGDDGLAFSGAFTVAPPVGLAIDPVAHGVAIRPVDGPNVVLDAQVPGGAYDPTTRTGWKVNRTGAQWTFVGPKTGSVGGITKVVLTDRGGRRPGRCPSASSAGPGATPRARTSRPSSSCRPAVPASRPRSRRRRPRGRAVSSPRRRSAVGSGRAGGRPSTWRPS